MPEAPAEIRYDDRGLVPVVVQDRVTGAVLMVAWADAAAVAATERTGEAHFHSRSRGTLWRKGETSGNTMEVESIRIDCDRDTLLYEVWPTGPACHRGTHGCFDPPDGRRAAGFFWLEELVDVIADRAACRPSGSYTAELLAGGVDSPARKVIEEAAEVALAAKDHAVGLADDQRLAEEAADLLFHALVLLAERTVAPAEVMSVLRERRLPG